MFALFLSMRFSVGLGVHYDAIRITIGQSNKNGWIFCCHRWPCLTVNIAVEPFSQLVWQGAFAFIYTNFSVHSRSIFCVVRIVQFMDTGNDGCHISIHVPMFVAHVLAVHLPWTSTKWEEIPNILSAETNHYISNVAMCSCISNMGKVQRIARPNV